MAQYDSRIPKCHSLKQRLIWRDMNTLARLNVRYIHISTENVFMVKSSVTCPTVYIEKIWWHFTNFQGLKYSWDNVILTFYKVISILKVISNASQRVNTLFKHNFCLTFGLHCRIRFRLNKDILHCKNLSDSWNCTKYSMASITDFHRTRAEASSQIFHELESWRSLHS